MDRIFGEKKLINEIIWCYETGGRATNFFPKKHDIIFWYAKSEKYNFYYDQVALKRDPSTMHEPVLYDKKGKPYQRNIKMGKEYRYYLDKGVLPNDWWTDIQAINPSAKERLGYPTQKPEALLDRVIKASSNKNDIVLDPMVGGGTTVAVAQKLGRRWIGIDVSPTACKVTAKRLRSLGVHVAVLGMAKSTNDLKKFEPFEFQNWVCHQLQGKMSDRKSSDMGIDGWMMGTIPIQVKQSDDVGRNAIDNFETAIRRANKKKGVFVAFSYGKGAYEEVARAKSHDGIEIIALTVEDMLKPEFNAMSLLKS